MQFQTELGNEGTKILSTATKLGGLESSASFGLATELPSVPVGVGTRVRARAIGFRTSNSC
jgi:hypothetical protein